MGEEIKKPGAELNDAALEQASGGDGWEIRAAMRSAGSKCDRMMAAREVCGSCPKNGQSCSSQLAHYMANVHEVLSPSGCPFSDEARGG